MVNKEQENKIIEETRKLVNLFLETNESDIELSKRTGISSSTVGRRLTNSEYIEKAYPYSYQEKIDEIKKRRKENQLRGRIIGGQKVVLNNVALRDEIGKFKGSIKLQLDTIYKKEENQNKFLVYSALTFRLHLDTLSNLFKIDEDELYKKMMSATGNQVALHYLFEFDIKDQELAKGCFVDYYVRLFNAIQEKDLENVKKLKSEIMDTEVIEFRKKHNSGDKLSDETILMILRFQLKYALSTTNTAELFNINRQNYTNRVYALIENDFELRKSYEHLTTIKDAIHRKGTRNV